MSLGTMPTQFNTLINQSTIGGGAGSQGTDRGAGGTSLADEYRQRQKEMDERLKKEIDIHKIASVYPQGTNPPLQAMRVPGENQQNNLIPTYEAKPSKFVRSQRSIAMRIKEDYDDHAENKEQEKMQLIQRLNEAMIELDRLNQEKGELNEKLIKLFQFTRDMERHTLRSDDLLTVVDESLKEELRSEKQQGIRMQEQMKGFEEEKYRIREQVCSVDNRRDQLEHQKVDIQLHYEQRSREVSEIEVEYRDTKDRINAFQTEVDDLKALCLQLQEMVNGHRHDLHYTNGGKLCLADQFDQIDRKFCYTQETTTRELNELQFRQKRKSKLMATLILTKRLVDIANRNSYNSTLSTLRKFSKVKRATMQGLLRLRRILKQNRRARLRRVLYHWYFKELKPLSNYHQSRETQKVLMKRHKSFKAFYAWRVALYRKVEQIHLKLSHLQRLVTMKTHKSQVAMKEFFVRWRHTVNIRYSEWHKIDRLRKILVERDTQIMRNSLFKWKALVIDLENQIQSRSMLKKFTLKSFVVSVFQNWRHVIADNRSKRLTLMSKSWKSLRMHVMTEKHLRGQEVLIKRELRLRWKKNVVKACFDGFRHNKQEEKLQRVTKILEVDEIPRKLKCLEDMDLIKRERHDELLLLAVQKIKNFKQRQLFQYFQKWQEKTDLAKSFINTDVKQKLIYRFKWILSQGFMRLIDHRNKTMIKQQEETNSQWDSKNKALIFEIKGENVIIDNFKDRQKVEAAKFLKKLIMSAFERHLRVKYVQWRDSVNYLIEREQRIERILLKQNERRMKRLGFNTFMDKIQICREDQQDDKAGDQARELLSNRLKMNCFNKMKRNALNSIHSKEITQRLLLKLDLNHKDEAFKLWLKYLNHQRERALETTQNQVVNNISQCQAEIGGLSDSVEVQNQLNQSLRDRYKQTCQKIISLAFKRCHYMGHQYYFERWKNKVCDYRRGQRTLMNAAQHATSAALKYSFNQWYINASVNVKQKSLISNLNYEEKVTSQVRQEMAENLHEHEFKSDTLSAQIGREKYVSEVLEVKHSRCLTFIVNRVNNNHYCHKLRYILNQWHEFTQTRKRCVNALELAIKKTLWQKGFNTIRERAREIQLMQNKEHQTKMFALKFTKIQYRSYFKQWLSQGQKKVLQISHKAQENRLIRIKDQEKLVKVVNSRVKSQLIDNRKYVIQFECFQAWRDEIKTIKAFKVKHQLHKQWQMQRDKQDSVKLWRYRLKKTKHYRKTMNATTGRFVSNLLHQTFDAWLLYNRLNKDLARSLSNIANKVDKVYKLRAFESIREHSETSNTITLFSKFKSCQYLFSTVQSVFNNQTVRSTFYTIRHSGIRMTRNEKAIKSIAKFWVGQKLRGYVRQWKEETDRLETLRFNLQEGRVSVEVHNEKRSLNALKQMCLLEGISPAKIHKLIIRTDERSNEVVMRVVSRLLCHGDEQLRIIPSCFDRWRQWVRFRKMFAYWLKFANSFANPKIHGLARAFRQWKYLKIDQKEQLTALKSNRLSRLCVANDTSLYNLAHSFEGATSEIEDLTSQRGILLQRYVSSQKLALASVVKQNERAQQKVVSRWLSQCKRTEKVKLDEVLKQNLMRIASLKDRIKHLEGSNQEIAIQNEDFRQGALDGIEMARNLDDLQREKEVLAIDLADKAVVIRRLLEDNSNLNAQLAHAQEHAHRLIQITHARLNNNTHHPPLH